MIVCGKGAVNEENWKIALLLQFLVVVVEVVENAFFARYFLFHAKKLH